MLTVMHTGILHDVLKNAAATSLMEKILGAVEDLLNKLRSGGVYCSIDVTCRVAPDG